MTGNHDAHPESSVLHRFAPHIQNLPITILDSLEGTTTHLGELDLTVWGKSPAFPSPSTSWHLNIA